MHLCPDCATKLQSKLIMMEQSKQNRQENFVGGIVGAFLGSLLGIICIIVLGRMGYVASLSGVAMAVGVLKGYELLGGKISTKGIVASAVIMLLMTYVGNRLDWAIELLSAGGGADAGYHLFECYRMVPMCVREGVIDLVSYVGNLVLIYLFTALGAVPTIRAKLREKKESGHIIRLG